MGKLFIDIPTLLDPSMPQLLLEFALAQAGEFEPSSVGSYEGRVDVNLRQSQVLRELASFREPLEHAVLSRVPEIVAELGLAPFDVAEVELELVAHGHGAFFKTHIDTFTGTNVASENSDRVISLLYYFYREPKAFSGGELRLHPPPWISASKGPVDIAPTQARSVAFASWLPHEVLQVECPSGKLEDARFAINAWVLRKRPG